MRFPVLCTHNSAQYRGMQITTVVNVSQSPENNYNIIDEMEQCLKGLAE